ncbi:hypothetical protein LCGC14_0834210 [marine sediment metagenome]|uniref:Uncharacterized protein n=1 Tax=marine sediment metagenome TaxID=412755 RepID=A0A0F9SME8_9ZZZZ
MANVKLNNKSLLEKLQAEITLKLGKKMSQQDVLDKSIEFVYKRLDDFISEHIDHPPITEELIKRIKETAIDVPLEHPEKSDDELIYGL